MGCDKADIPDSPLHKKVKKLKMKIPGVKKIKKVIDKIASIVGKKDSKKDASNHETGGKSNTLSTEMVVSKTHNDNALPSADVVIYRKYKAMQSKTENEPPLDSAKLSTFPKPDCVKKAKVDIRQSPSESDLSTATDIIPIKSNDTLSERPNDTNIVETDSVAYLTAPEEVKIISVDNTFAVTGTTYFRHGSYGTTSRIEEAPVSRTSDINHVKGINDTSNYKNSSSKSTVEQTDHVDAFRSVETESEKKCAADEKSNGSVSDCSLCPVCTNQISNSTTYLNHPRSMQNNCLYKSNELETATNETLSKVQSQTTVLSSNTVKNTKYYNKAKSNAAEKHTRTLPNEHEESGIVLDLKISRPANDFDQDTKIKVVIQLNPTQSSHADSDVSLLEESVDNQVPQRVSPTSSQDCYDLGGLIYKTPDVTTLLKQTAKQCIKRFSSWCFRKIPSGEKCSREGQTTMRSETETTICQKKACSKMTRCDALRKGNKEVMYSQKSTDKARVNCNEKQGGRKKQTKEACKKEKKRKKRTFSRIKDWAHKIWKRIINFSDSTKMKERCNSMATFHKDKDRVFYWDKLEPLFGCELNESIGCLEVHSGSHGTAFRVGNGRLVMTAYHVVEDVIESAVAEIANRIIYLSSDCGLIIDKISKELGVEHNYATTLEAEDTLKAVLWTFFKSSKSGINITNLLRRLGRVLDEDIINKMQMLLNTNLWTDAFTISFGKKETKFSFLYDIPFVDELHDFIILELAGTNKVPKPLVLDASVPSGFVTMLGYPDKKELQVDFDCRVYENEKDLGSAIEKAKNWWMSKQPDQDRCFIEDGFKNMTGKTILHTSRSFEHGASGGPGVKVDDRFNYPTVSMIYQGGFPEFFYKSNTGGSNSLYKCEEAPEHVKFEAGLSMKQVARLLMKAGKSSLKKEIFDKVQL